MLNAIAPIVGAFLIGTAAILAVFLGGMRTKWPPVVDTVRRLNMRMMNPRQMETAGQPGAFAGILRHTGRTSGEAYETPLGIEPTEDGFVIAMVYGERTQWARNVLAAGHATVVVAGETWEVDRPAIVPLADVAGFFSPSDHRMVGLFGVKECLRLHKVEGAD